MSPELSQLIELQELDFEIQRIADKLDSIPAEREQAEETFNQYAAEFLALKNQHEHTLEERTRLENELAETQAHHEKFKQDLMRVSNEKEYVTALREIDATKKHAGTLETEILKCMEEAENLAVQLTTFTPDIEAKRAEVDLALDSLEKEKGSSEGRIKILEVRRAEIASAVSGNILSMYDRVAKARRGQALSEVRDGICSACRMRVRPKIFSDVRRGDQLITCDSCSRILFYRPNTNQSAEAVTR